MRQGRCFRLIDIESSIFSPIAEEFSTQYPNGSRYGEPTEIPAKFPCLVLYESDKFYSGHTNLDSARIVIDVDVFSNLTSGAKQQCKEIMEFVETRLMSFGLWEPVFCNQIKNAEARIFRMKARYRVTAVQEQEVNGIITVRLYRK